MGPDASTSFALGVLTIWALVFLRGIVGIRRTPKLDPKPGLDVTAQVTVFVPARDEVEIIEQSVDALLRQGSLLARIVVIDDRSTDGTSDKLAQMKARSDRLEVLDGAGPKPGQCGKPAALASAFAQFVPTTEWLLFVDADVVLAEGAIEALVEHANATGADLVSGFPQMVYGSALEHIVMPSIGAAVVAQYPPGRVADPASDVAFANGQLIFVRRSTYEGIGGHDAVISEILEDVRLAEHIKRSGGRLSAVDLSRVASTRMYSSWPQMREGWSKNLYLLIGRRPGAAIKWAIIACVLGWAGLTALLVAGWPVGLAVFLATVSMQAGLRFFGGASLTWAPFAPIGALVFAYLLLRSMRLHRAHANIAWKGRTYDGGA